MQTCRIRSKTTFRRHLHRPRYKKQITEGEIKRRPKYCAQQRIRGRNFISSYFRIYAAGGKGRRTGRNASNKILGCGKRRRAEYRRVVISYEDSDVTFVTFKHRFPRMQFLRNPSRLNFPVTSGAF